MFKTLIIVLALTAGSLTKSSSWNPFGIVEGIANCGLPDRGTLGDVAVTDCTQTPCFFSPDKVYDVSVRFAASLTSNNLALFVTLEDDTAILQVPIPGEIEAEVEYELAFPLQVTRDYAGLTFNIRFQIFDVASFRVEICAQASVTIGE